MPRQDETLQIPSTLTVVTPDDLVLFPGTVAALEVDEDGAAQAKKQRDQQGGLVLVAVAEEAPAAAEATGADEDEQPASPLRLGPIGTVGRIIDIARNEQGARVVVLQGLARVRVEELLAESPLPVARVSPLPKASGPGAAQLQALVVEAKRLSRDILALLPGVPAEVGAQIQALEDPAQLADLLAFRVPAPFAEKRAALEELDLEKRLGLVVKMLGRRREVLEVSHKIDGAVREEMGRAEREHVLRRKLKAVERELAQLSGEPEDDGKNGADQLAAQLKALPLPPDVRTQVDKELRRLGSMNAQGAEVAVARTWLQWIADLPWGKSTTDNLDVNNAQAILDADHQGLQKVKARITQYLAVRTLKGDMKGPILCLVGPPGVGKTSLGQSIAKAMGRKFVRVSLGGVRDEAEVRGHRRTYVGAMPGRLIQALKRAGTSNPVVMLDEIDKLGRGFQGDPGAALLEVLDPEQNHTFADHYLEVPFDLSKILFIATANTLETVPGPLLDRMEVLEIPSYTIAEKVEIARTHLVPKQVEAHGLAGVALTVEDGALQRLVTAHTREAGVRGLEKRIADLLRAVAVEKASGELGGGVGRVITAAEVERILGPDRFVPESMDRTEEPGVATGLAWTPVGGDVLFIEATQMPGKGQLIISGQLGDVMRESVQAAVSWVRAHAGELGLPAEPLKDRDVHIHFPAGATPKDGPSAGVTIVTALVSLLTGTRVRGDVAMTGEVTLRGRVLPVGGIKEKVLAAHRLGLRRVILPERCARDLPEIPETVRKELEFVFATTVEDVLEAALEKSPLGRPAGAAAAGSTLLSRPVSSPA